jgi:hypothetical protein
MIGFWCFIVIALSAVAQATNSRPNLRISAPALSLPILVNLNLKHDEHEEEAESVLMRRRSWLDRNRAAHRESHSVYH